MCGLAGIVAWDDRFRVDRSTLDAMGRAVAHRGPDGEGVYLNHTEFVTPFKPQCGLVHRRLAVIDLDERGLQPFDDGGLGKWLVYNGEVYNFRELRARVAGANPRYRWRTECDTEVVLAALETWGPSALTQFNGMLAMAMWDQATQSLLLARDRMGQKPLYYAAVDAAGRPWQGFVAHEGKGDAVEIWSNAECPAAVAFASELGALRAVPWFDVSAVDYVALAEYLRWGYVPAPATIYRSAAKLPPAMWMRLNHRGCDRESYFDANAVESPAPVEAVEALDPVARTRELILSAVRRQLVADVPLGCFLSGGVDSSIIAAAMTLSTGDARQVRTFTVGFDDARYDETPFAAEVARHLGTAHEQIRVQPRAADDLPRLAEVYGEPFGDSSALPTHYLSRETRRDVKVALSGDGGDELFGGYDRYRAMAITERINRLPAVVRDVVVARCWQWLPGIHPKGRISRLKRLLGSAHLPPGERYASYVRLFDEATLQPLLGVAGPIVETDDRIAHLHQHFAAAGRCPVTAALAADRVSYLPDDLLAKVDRASMLHGLEVRSPFMDHDLVRFAAGLRADQLFTHPSPRRAQGKRLLQQAFAGDLPPSVFDRPKAGFALPIGQWLRGALRGMLNDLLFSPDSFLNGHMVPGEARKLVDQHQRGRRDHAQRLYALLMLELWWRSHGKRL